MTAALVSAVCLGGMIAFGMSIEASAASRVLERHPAVSVAKMYQHVVSDDIVAERGRYAEVLYDVIYKDIQPQYGYYILNGSGRTLIRFKVDRNGRVGSISVEESAGDPHLDRTAVRLLKRASAKFPKPPSLLSAWPSWFTVGINFHAFEAR